MFCFEISCESIIISVCRVRKNVLGASDKPPVQTTQPLVAVGLYERGGRDMSDFALRIVDGYWLV